MAVESISSKRLLSMAGLNERQGVRLPFLRYESWTRVYRKVDRGEAVVSGRYATRPKCKKRECCVVGRGGTSARMLDSACFSCSAGAALCLRTARHRYDAVQRQASQLLSFSTASASKHQQVATCWLLSIRSAIRHTNS